MFKKRKEEQKQLVITSLTYMRLLSDVAALEDALEQYRPLEQSETGSFFAWLLETVKTEATNDHRQRVSEDLRAKKKVAKEMLAAFEKTTPKKQLALAKEPEKLKAYINKKLFKKDASGAERIRFALAFMVAPSYQYQLSKESLVPVSQVLFDDGARMGELYGLLQENYLAVCKRSPVEDLAVYREIKQIFTSIFSAMPCYVLETVTLGGKLRSRSKETLMALSLEEEKTYLAMQLTLVETLKTSLEKDALAMLADAVLKRIGDLRADAEYEWIVERQNERACRERIEGYGRAIERLNAILAD